MKQNLTFNVSLISSTASKTNTDMWDESLDSFDKKEYRKSFEEFLDYLNTDFRRKYGNAQGTEFSIPHGSIVVNIKFDNDQMKVNAPFLSLPEKNVIPLLRQVAALNFVNLNLAQIILKDGKLNFEYECPIELINPWKIYYIFDEICITGDKYDDEYVTKFGATRISEPRVTPYDTNTVDVVYAVLQQSCDECLENVKIFETDRKYGFAWNVIASTLYKIAYYAHPQGQFLNDLDKAISEHEREDLPLPDVVMRGKEFVQQLKAIPKAKLAENLYYIETFIPPKRRSSLENIQENFESTFDRVTQEMGAREYLSVTLRIILKFYEMYYYNNLQDNINAIAVDAMSRASAQPFEVAAPILFKAMKKIMDGDLSLETGVSDYAAMISTGISKLKSFFKK